MLKNHSSKYYLGARLLMLVAFVLLIPSSKTQAATQADAIAVRILPNPNHYSVERWYKEQDFTGSPQALIIDGYDAIRDGRTVYVNAANVGTSTNSIYPNIYTNIYLISYNQTTNQQTADILGQIVAHWKFNNNLATGDLEGKCEIGTSACETDKDCAAGLTCNNNKKCSPAAIIKCYSDTDCQAGIFCSSVKAQIVRDIKRVSILSELNESLFAYKKINKRYPVLDSGTFVKNNTVSTWPSWKEVFLPQIGVNPSIIDPINALGYCPSFEAATCWDKNSSKFYGIPGVILDFPDNSKIIYYSSDANGSKYQLCAGMESIASPNNYTMLDGPNDDRLQKFNCASIENSSNAGNTAPVIIDSQLTGTTGQPFVGFIKAYDKENNPLKFTVSALDTDLSSLKTQTTNNPNQIRVYSASVPKGSHDFNINVFDGAATTTLLMTVNISDSPVYLEAEDIDHVLQVNNKLVYSFNYQGLSNLQKSLDCSANPFFDVGFTISSFQIASSKFKVTAVSNLFDLKDYVVVPHFQKNESFSCIVKVGSTTKTIKINLIVEPPVLDFNCPLEARLGRPYSCFIGDEIQAPHSVIYQGDFANSTSGDAIASTTLNLDLNNKYPPSYFIPQSSETLPTDPVDPGSGAYEGRLDLKTKTVAWFNNLNNLKNLVSNFSSLLVKKALAYIVPTPPPIDPTKYYLWGRATSSPQTVSVDVLATNEYGTQSKKKIDIKLNNYCGNDVKEYPNSEGKGGYYNDGYEDCDGAGGVSAGSTIIASSSISLQYACKSNPTLVYPIKTSGYCVFASPLEGGGFCGDGLCETSTSDGKTLETPVNCSVDCGPAGPIGNNCGNGIKNPGELCDCTSTVALLCDLGGKTCKDFNIWAVDPFNGLNLKCGNNPGQGNQEDCDSFYDPLTTSSCLYLHQVFSNSAFLCEPTWKNCDHDVTNGCESQCCGSCTGRECGSNGCAEAADDFCGSCPNGKVCNPSGQCCTKNCAGKECGPDGCGGYCGNGNGTCPESKPLCINSVCKKPNCPSGNNPVAYCASGEICCNPIEGNAYCYPHNSPPSFCTGQ